MTTAAAPTAPPAWLLAVVSLLGGVATSLAFAPTTWTPLVVVGPAVALWAWTHASTARLGALYGVLYGWSFSFPAFRWILEVDAVAGVVLPAIQGCFWAVTGAVAAVASARLRPSWWVAVVAATWTLVEVSRARVPLTGFEWGQLSMATADTPVRQAAAAVGALGVTGAMVAVAAGLATLAFRRDRRSPVPLLVSFVVVGLAVGMGLVRWTSPVADLDVAVIQVDDPCPGVFAQDCPGYSTELLRSYVAGAAQLDRAPDLMVWGEDALLGAETLQQVGTRLMRDAGALPAPLLAGAGTPTAPGRFLRWAALFDANGVAVDGYAKRMPVPFGEYVPLRGLLGGISQVGRLVPNDLEAGQDASPVVLRTDTGVVSLGTVVSWEVTFSRAVRAVAAEANGLATLTTVASYDTTAASDQLLDAAQLRAAEHQKPMVVAATTGRSALIAPTGAMEASSALFRADQLTGSLALRTGLTPFARFGDLPVVLVAVAILLAAVRPWRRVALDETSEAPTGQRGACRSADALPR